MSARASGAGIIVLAGLVVGGLVSAPLNGGKPYGFDLPIDVERFEQEQPQPALPTPEQDLPRKDGPAIARTPGGVAAG